MHLLRVWDGQARLKQAAEKVESEEVPSAKADSGNHK